MYHTPGGDEEEGEADGGGYRCRGVDVDDAAAARSTPCVPLPALREMLACRSELKTVCARCAVTSKVLSRCRYNMLG